MSARNQIIRYILSGIVLMAGSQMAHAQDSTSRSDQNTSQEVVKMKSGESQFMMVGLATLGFVNQNMTTTINGVKTSSKTNSFGDADRYEFSPMFLWRHGDNFLAEFEPSFDGNGLGVNWADISYFVTPGLIVRGGYLVLPFGIYNKRLAAGWINKLASDPAGMDMAGTDFGVEIEGGMPLGNMKWSYDISLSNGLQLNPDGTTQTVGINAINNGKTVCGRLALLPLSNSSLELGVSGLYGSLGTAQGSYNNPMVNMYAVDLNFVHHINPFQINIKAQYNIMNVNKQDYVNPGDSSAHYSFTNTTTAAFGQIALRPDLVDNKVLKNLELAYRYVYYKTPENSTWGQNYTEHNIALDYWLSWRTVLKLVYENVKYDGTATATIAGPQGSTSVNRVILQFSTEF
jgi:hypothetical protein